MKKTFLLLLLLVSGCFSSTPAPTVQATEWFDSGVVSAPGTGAVLVDMGPEDDGDNFSGCIDMTASVAATFELQHRNAANNATLHSQRYPISLGGVEHYCWTNAPIAIADDERIRLVNVNTILVGTVQVSIYHQ